MVKDFYKNIKVEFKIKRFNGSKKKKVVKYNI